MNALNTLLDFALHHGLLNLEDRLYAQNALLQALGLLGPADDEACFNEIPETVGPILTALCDFAVRQGMIEDAPFEREQFGDHLLSLLLPLPSAVSGEFRRLYEEKGASAATDWYYRFCCASNAIHVDSIRKNIAYAAPSEYGELEITINLSKPEKDPREIARQRSMPQVGYPSCMLCVENEGYAGRPGYPTHETLRTVRLEMCGEPWRMQYSPYSYYNEHCIVLDEKHTPMKINRRTFALLTDFVNQFPAYFLGSNADLPIVGGSILNHNHFQGGRHVFPMDRAPVTHRFFHPDYPDVQVGIVRWPMSCLDVRSVNKQQLLDFCEALLACWREYDDPSVNVIHETDGTPHNTVTPIVRKDGDAYVMRLVLRNNRTSTEHPLGIFHPHTSLHHIKRENIGLIEVMGLFILPGRLKAELEGLEGYLTGAKPLVRPDADDPLYKHYEWISDIAAEHGTSHSAEEAVSILRKELAKVCAHVLEDAGVFKCTAEGSEAFHRFLRHLGLQAAE